MTLLAAACAGNGAGPADSAAEPFAESLDPAALHLLVTATPLDDATDPLMELGVDFSTIWSSSVTDGDGVMGAYRSADGSTTFARSGLPPEFDSNVERIDADDETVFSYNDVFTGGIGFSHGVVPTSDGDVVALDTSGSRLVCFDTEGAQLWEMVFYDEDSSQLPNGIAVRDDLVAITRLWHTGSDVVDHVALYRLTDRTTAPTMVWETAMEGNGTGLWPHGPTITDGEVIITLAALGKIVGFDLETGEETWRIPGERSNAQLAFPRGAVPLPDGSFVVSDAGAELLRVWDAFGSFEVVDAVRVPGVFSVDVLDCADAACK